MRVLHLGPPSAVAETIGVTDEVSTTEHPVDPAAVSGFDLLVSYGYRHILSAALLDALPRPAINLHISYLPWNRGADPNLWSFIDATPKGVTIHEIDRGVDTGPILVQRRVEPEPGDTLATSYARLATAITALFDEYWSEIRAGVITPTPQDPAAGSSHRRADRSSIEHLLTSGWQTPITDIAPGQRDR